MNAQKAKLCRKAAREHLKGKGLPERVLHSNPRTTKEYEGVRLKADAEGKIIDPPELEQYRYKAAYGAINGPSVRGLYLELKKQYLYLLRTGEIKARYVKEVNRIKSINHSLKEAYYGTL
jgi:hypothetical protein